MANSFTSILIHIIFSTHIREQLLQSDFRNRLFAYMGGIARESKIKAISIGGVMDQAHMLTLIPASIAIAKAVQLIKGASSKWLHENIIPLNNFAWQEG